MGSHSMRTKQNTKTTVLAGLMIAMSIILTRLLSINISNEIRISFGNFPILLSGFLFGPIIGAVVGFSADFVGANIFGIGWNPLLSVSPVVIAVVAGFSGKLLKRNITYFRLVALSSLGYVLGPIFWTTYILSKMYGAPMSVLLYARVPIYVVTLLIDCLFIFSLYKQKAIRKRLDEYW